MYDDPKSIPSTFASTIIFELVKLFKHSMAIRHNEILLIVGSKELRVFIFTIFYFYWFNIKILDDNEI